MSDESKIRFKLIHRESGKTLGEWKNRNPLRYYIESFGLCEDNEFTNRAVRAIIREDGAIGFQRIHSGYDEGQIYFLVREEWDVQIKEEVE